MFKKLLPKLCFRNKQSATSEDTPTKLEEPYNINYAEPKSELASALKHYSTGCWYIEQEKGEVLHHPTLIGLESKMCVDGILAYDSVILNCGAITTKTNSLQKTVTLTSVEYQTIVSKVKGGTETLRIKGSDLRPQDFFLKNVDNNIQGAIIIEEHTKNVYEVDDISFQGVKEHG